VRSTALGDLKFLSLSFLHKAQVQASIAEESVALPLDSFLSEVPAVLLLCLLASFFLSNSDLSFFPFHTISIALDIQKKREFHQS
jgi:hypothetical protein